jgi:hypothetical protein
VLALEGVLYDLGLLEEGDLLPRAALGGDWLVSDVMRTGGVIRLTLLRPHGKDATEADRFPAALQGETEGDLQGLPGIIDWSQRQRAADRASAELADWRAGARMSRTDFCLALAQAGLLSGIEAVAAARGEIPGAFAPVVAMLPAPQQVELGIRWAAMNEVERLNPFIALVAQAVPIPAPFMDQIFGRG